ncbi:hypothetical protein [Providencia alcalifaciens]|uniref:hypothetical protein n=1 Tax=Providencia alcalifaciens TaxID=126385 RepID=UPI002B05F1EE|nr:hypothetical protein [Providencia alcalifaciens]
MKARLLAILIDVVVAASFYFGLILNNEGLTNIGYFTGWIFAILGLLLIFIGKAEFSKNYKHQSVAWRTYDILTDVAYVAFAAYSGWFVLATFFAIASIIKAVTKGEIEKELLKPA